jgi:hypothetical protein
VRPWQFVNGLRSGIMFTMAKQEKTRATNWRSDWWLWPLAFLLGAAGWGQAVWMWDNMVPTGFAPLWLLVWTGVGMAGITLVAYWLARRWWPVAWAMAAVWAAVPKAIEIATQNEDVLLQGGEWLPEFSPLLVLLLLGVGFDGALMSLAWYAGRRWSDWTSNTRALREAFWSGLFVLLAGLLFISRAFSLASVILLAGGLILIETYIVLRESAPEIGEAI